MLPVIAVSLPRYANAGAPREAPALYRSYLECVPAGQTGPPVAYSE